MPKSVLIIDDEPRISMALMTRLESHGYMVYHALNGLAGVEAAALHQPDVIIMDIRMPDIDGFDACIRIKRLPNLGDTPIIFLSANVQESARRRSLEVGGTTFIAKPYRPADVVQTIESVLSEQPDYPSPRSHHA